MTALAAAAVRVPCSTSNLGAGFDTLGLALDRYLDAGFEPGPPGGELLLEATGTLEGRTWEPDDDILVRAFRSSLEAQRASPSGLLRVHSDIPVARGLGSSAAATVAGWALGRAVLGAAEDPDGAFQATMRLEGHGDNAAPCVFGGLQAVVDTQDGIRATRLELHEEVGLAYAAPASRISTQEARESLPPYVTHRSAVAGLGRLAALLRGLALADGDLIRVGMQDELHVPHRLALIPGAVNAMAAGYDAGAWGVTISGSGSGLIALAPLDRVDEVAQALHRTLAPGADTESVGFSVRPDRDGVTIR